MVDSFFASPATAPYTRAAWPKPPAILDVPPTDSRPRASDRPAPTRASITAPATTRRIQSAVPRSARKYIGCGGSHEPRHAARRRRAEPLRPGPPGSEIRTVRRPEPTAPADPLFGGDDLSRPPMESLCPAAEAERPLRVVCPGELALLGTGGRGVFGSYAKGACWVTSPSRTRSSGRCPPIPAPSACASCTRNFPFSPLPAVISCVSTTVGGAPPRPRRSGWSRGLPRPRGAGLCPRWSRYPDLARSPKDETSAGRAVFWQSARVTAVDDERFPVMRRRHRTDAPEARRYWRRELVALRVDHADPDSPSFSIAPRPSVAPMALARPASALTRTFVPDVHLRRRHVQVHVQPVLWRSCPRRPSGSRSAGPCRQGP